MQLLARNAWLLIVLASAGIAVWLLLSAMARGNPRLRLRLWWERLRRRAGAEPILCRSCKWNNPQDCRHRKRPFATICEDYRRR